MYYLSSLFLHPDFELTMIKLYKSLFFLACFAGCLFLTLCKEEPLPDIPSDIGIDKFIIEPASPTAKDQVKLVTYGCKYNVLAYVKIKGKDIEVKKRYNSMMKWPCLLTQDTIPLGLLKDGNYKVLYLIVDTNPLVKDSVSVMEEVTLKVKK